jgi:hypothetical protein
VVFVADDLGAWLVGKLADAGSRRLIAWALGSEQERELRRAATAAVLLTAAELRPEGGEGAEELALVVSQVFGEPLAEVPPGRGGDAAGGAAGGDRGAAGCPR